MQDNKIEYTTFESKNGIFEKAYGYDQETKKFSFKLYLKSEGKNFSGVKLIESTKEPLFVNFDTIEMFLITANSDGSLHKTKIIPNAIDIGFGFAINIGTVKNDVLITFDTNQIINTESLYLTRTSLKFDGGNDVSEKFEIASPDATGKGKLEIRKNFILGYEEVVSSVNYEVYDSSNKKITSFGLDDKRRASVELYPGSYHIMEKHDPKYNLDSPDGKLVVIEAGKSEKITFENRDITGKIKILKRDPNTLELVGEGTFILTNMLTGSRKKFVINDLVCYTVSGVPYGPYQLEESISNINEKVDEPIKFEISKNDDFHELTFYKNNKIGKIETMFDEFSQVPDLEKEDIKDVDDLIGADTVNLEQNVKEQLQSADAIMAETFDMNDELKIAKAMAEMARNGETNIIDQVYSNDENLNQEISDDVTAVVEEVNLNDEEVQEETSNKKSKKKKEKKKKKPKEKKVAKKKKEKFSDDDDIKEKSSQVLNYIILVVALILVALLIAFGMFNA